MYASISTVGIFQPRSFWRLNKLVCFPDFQRSEVWRTEAPPEHFKQSIILRFSVLTRWQVLLRCQHPSVMPGKTRPQGLYQLNLMKMASCSSSTRALPPLWSQRTPPAPGSAPATDMELAGVNFQPSGRLSGLSKWTQSPSTSCAVDVAAVVLPGSGVSGTWSQQMKNSSVQNSL